MKYRFGEFVLDLEAGRLLGPDGEVRLRPQPFRLLQVLVENAPRILSQEELLDLVWGVEHLSPASVKQAVSEVRQALRDDPSRPAAIETVPRRGYRFIAALARVEEEAPQLPVVSADAEFGTWPVVLSERARRVVEEAIEEDAAAPPAAAVPASGSRRAALALVIGLAALGITVFALLVRATPDGAPPAGKAAEAPAARAAARPATRPAARPAVAVLGFKNLSGDPGDDWISGALAEIIGFELAAPGRVRLIPGENVERMRRELALPHAERHAPATLARIGRNLGTDLVVAGSYLRTPGEDGEDKLRVQMVVQSVATGDTVAWARHTGAPESLIELATAAVRGVQVGLGTAVPGIAAGGDAAAALASNAASLQLYSEALARLRVWNAPAALPLLEQAAAADPGNPFVHDALAGALAELGFEGEGKKAAGRAVGLARELPQELRLGIEGRFHALSGAWEEAAGIYTALWRLHPDDLEPGLRLAHAQRQAGQTGGALATVAALRRLPSPAGDDPRIDLEEADAAWQGADFARARDAASRAVAKSERRGTALLTAAGLFNRAWSALRLGDSRAALADFRQAHDLYIRMGDRGAAMGALLGSASVLQATGRPAEARQAYERAIPVLRESGDRRREAKALNNFAALLADQGDFDAVTRLLERSLEVKREIGDLQGAATTLANLGNLLRQRGDLAGARRRTDEALALSRRLGDAHGTALALRGMARVLDHQGQGAEARAALEEALELGRGSGDAEGVAQTRIALGELARRAKRPDEAREHFREALAEFERLGRTGNVAHSRIALAEIDLEQGRLDAARAGFAAALALARSLENDLYEAHAHSGLAEVATRKGDVTGARGEHERALALWLKLEDEEKAARARKALQELKG
ncbi:MAG TPA: tetratricopeptide repeat protein [Thermoanaerobaculia bacterium]|nr:tetratricopeptide repeat protein [Thermoanaerobaculia bacterium]